MDIGLIVLIVLCAWFLSGFKIIDQQTIGIVETLGKYSRTIHPGLNFLWFPPIQKVAGRVSLRITEISANAQRVSIKTTDNVFVGLPVSIMIRVIPEDAYESFYQLSNPESQIQTWILNSVRSTTSGMTLQELFDDRSKIVAGVEDDLSEKFRAYGYVIEAVLVDEPSIPLEMQSSFNAVISAQREKEAAVFQGEAAMIKMVKNAEAEAQSQIKRAEGLSKSREILADGIKQSIDKIEGKDISATSAMNILIETSRIDAMRDIGKHGNLVITDLGGDVSDKVLLALQAKDIKQHSTIEA